VSICRYFEELQPNPPLFGTGAKDKAIVDMWNRRMEIRGTAADRRRNSDSAHEFFKGRIRQVPEYAGRPTS